MRTAIYRVTPDRRGDDKVRLRSSFALYPCHASTEVWNRLLVNHTSMRPLLQRSAKLMSLQVDWSLRLQWTLILKANRD